MKSKKKYKRINAYKAEVLAKGESITIAGTAYKRYWFPEARGYSIVRDDESHRATV